MISNPKRKYVTLIVLAIIISLSVIVSSVTVFSSSDGSEPQTLSEDELPEKYVISNFPYFKLGYFSMYDYWSTCAMTSLEMVLEYYEFHYSINTLMNLGWQYGATLVENESGPVLMPGAEQPITAISGAAGRLGFSVEETNNQTENEAWQTLKSYLAQDVPVIVQWTMHTVVAVGYDETGTEDKVIFQNPGSPSALLENFYGGREVKVKADIGALSRMSREEWFSERCWQNVHSYPPKRFEMIVLTPPESRVSIDWGDVLQRNAQRTLASGDWASYPPYVWYGADAFAKAAEMIDSGEWGFSELESLFQASGWGPASRSHHSAFLVGLAEGTGIEKLRTAGRKFEISGYLWQQALQVWEHARRSSEEVDRSKALSEIALALKGAGIVEQNAGEDLLSAARTLADDG